MRLVQFFRKSSPQVIRKSSELLMKVDYTAWFDSEPNNSGDGEGNFKIIELPISAFILFFNVLLVSFSNV